MIKGVIFDLDGVVVSTDNLHSKAWLETCEKRNIDFPENMLDCFRGVGRNECVSLICDTCGLTMTKEEKESFAQDKNNLYIKLLEELSQDDILPYVNELLQKLKMVNIKIAIASSSQNARLILEKIGLLNTFDLIVDGTMIEHSKPHPEVFSKAVEGLGLEASECIVLEDANSGMIAAKAANCIAIKV